MDKDIFRYLVGGYFGVRSMDEYELKEYVLKDIEDYIKNYIEQNPTPDYDYVTEASLVDDELSLLEKLNDSLLIFKEIEVPMELLLLIKRKIKSIKEENLNSSINTNQFLT